MVGAVVSEGAGCVCCAPRHGGKEVVEQGRMCERFWYTSIGMCDVCECLV